jgi:hypothetical protein
LTDWKRGVDEDGGVNVWGIHFGAGDTGFFDEDAAFDADLGGVKAFDAALDGAHGFVPASFAGHVVNLPVHVVGAGAFFFGIIEDAGALELAVFDEVHEFVEVGIGFAREADDEGGANGDAGDASADAFEEVPNVGAIRFTTHESQHVIADVLQGHVDVASHFWAFGDGLNEVVAPVGRMGVEEADPEVAFDFVESPNECGEGFAFGRVDATAGFGAVFGPLVHAEVGGVLGDEIDFLDSGSDEVARFFDDGFLGATAVAAADLRDDAEGAGMVAAFRNFDVSEVFGGEAEARGVVVGDVFGLPSDEVFLSLRSHEALDDGGNGGDLVEADEGVDVGHEAGKVLSEALGKATGDDDFLFFALGSAFLAGVDGIVDGANGLLLGHVNEGAGVDDEDVGEFGFRGHGHARLLEVTDHDFGIDEVFSAAKRDESDFDHELRGGASYRREADRRGSVIWGNRIGGLRQGATD